MTAGDGRCTVVIPVYNEAPFVEGVVRDVVSTLSAEGYPHDVVVLNDGSTDWTDEVEQRLLGIDNVSLESLYPNRGKGAALDHVFPRLRSELVIVIDADGEYPPGDIPLVLEPLRRGDAEWVMGSRYGYGRPRPRQYLATYLVNRLMSAVFSTLARVRLRDVLTGIYGFRREVVEGIRLEQARFSYTPELLWKVRRRPSTRMAEVPVRYRFRTYAEGKKIRWWETGTILGAILRYALATRRRP